MTTVTKEHVTFIAPDITDGRSVARAQDAVRGLEGVIAAFANAETRFVDVDFDPTKTTADTVAAALSEAGYPVQG